MKPKPTRVAPGLGAHRGVISLILLAGLVTSLLAGSLSGCGGRVPEPQTAQKVITKYFKKYGKKYRWSDFGQYPLQKVEIGEIREIQKHLAEVEAFTYLTEGGPVHQVRVQVQKKTLGWRAIAWENLGTR